MSEVLLSTPWTTTDIMSPVVVKRKQRRSGVWDVVRD